MANLEVTDVGYEICQERVAGNVEWYPQTLERGGFEQNYVK